MTPATFIRYYTILYYAITNYRSISILSCFASIGIARIRPSLSSPYPIMSVNNLQFIKIYTFFFFVKPLITNQLLSNKPYLLTFNRPPTGPTTDLQFSTWNPWAFTALYCDGSNLTSVTAVN